MENITVKYQAVTPYLMLKDAEGFIKFMMDVFGATEIRRVTDKGKILHADIEVNGAVIMLADESEFSEQTAGLNFYTENPDEVYHKALKHGAESILKLDDRRYGRSAGIRDPFGNIIWINNRQL